MLLQLLLVFVLVEIVELLHVVHEGSLILLLLHIPHDSLRRLQYLGEALGRLVRISNTLRTLILADLFFFLEQIFSVLLGLLLADRLVQERLRVLMRLLLEVSLEHFCFSFGNELDEARIRCQRLVAGRCLLSE